MGPDDFDVIREAVGVVQAEQSQLGTLLKQASGSTPEARIEAINSVLTDYWRDVPTTIQQCDQPDQIFPDGISRDYAERHMVRDNLGRYHF